MTKSSHCNVMLLLPSNTILNLCIDVPCSNNQYHGLRFSNQIHHIDLLSKIPLRKCMWLVARGIGKAVDLQWSDSLPGVQVY